MGARPVAWSRDALLSGGAMLLLAAFYARQFALRLGDPDLWGRLVVGELFLRAGAMPAADPFAYTPTLPLWVDHEWLTGVVFYSLFQVWGDAGILVFKTLLGLAAVGLTWLTARRAGSTWLAMVAMFAVAMPVFGYGLMPRAQLFTYFFFALWLYLLEGYRRGGERWPMFALPITMVAWCNLHGGFLAGMGLLTLYAVGMIGDRRGRLLLGMLLTCACATLINPYGFDYWLYLIPAVTMRRPGVAEWAPVPWNVTYFPFWILAILAVAALWQLRDQWRQSLAPMLVIGVTLVLAMRHARHMPLFAIACCGLTPGILFPRPRPYCSLIGVARRADVLMALTMLLLACFQLYGMAALDGPAEFALPQSTAIENMVIYPVNAIDFLQRDPQGGNLAVPFNWGEYAIWRLWPTCRVSLDGRYETAYPDATVQMVDDFFAVRGDWRALIDQYPTRLVLAPAGSPINERLAAEADWRREYTDPVATVWRRRP
ncbi:MAG: hypothetical protein K1X71_13190 [Pirellulales bacterium]|nr:hypothetical protein [Pirellulales bacterium]